MHVMYACTTDEKSPDTDDEYGLPDSHDDETGSEDDGADLAEALLPYLVDDETTHHGTGKDPQQKGTR